MSEQIGFQVVITAWIGDDEGTFTLNRLPADRAEELLRQWQRPSWLRKGVGVEAFNDEGDEVLVFWRELTGLRIQPQVEVIV